MNKILKYSFIIIMLLSLVINFYLLMIIGQISLDSQNEIYLNDIAWCESSNDMVDLVNNLLDELSHHNPDYVNIGRLEDLDCWNSELQDASVGEAE